MSTLQRQVAAMFCALAACSQAFALNIGQIDLEQARLRSPDGSINLQAARAAKLQRDQLVLAGAGAVSAATANAARLGWDALAPGGAGRVRSIAVHPTIAGRIFVSSPGGGMWRVDDGVGITPKAQEMLNYRISQIVIAPSDPNTMYAGTGEWVDGYDRQTPGGGIFKSTDGGETWAVIPSTVPQAEGGTWSVIYRLWVSPTDANTVLASTNGGVLKTETGGSPRPSAGAPWTPISVPVTNSLTVTDIASNPNDPTQLAIADRTSGVAWSNDGGSTWTRSTGIAGFARIYLAWYGNNQTHTSVLYALRGDDPTSSLYQSIDGGRTFSVVNSTVALPLPSGSDACFWVDPSDRSRLTIGGARAQLLSHDGGVSFDAPTDLDAGCLTIAVPLNYDSVSNAAIYQGDEAGIWLHQLDPTKPRHGPFRLFRTEQFNSVAANSQWMVGGTPLGFFYMSPSQPFWQNVQPQQLLSVGPSSGFGTLSTEVGKESYVIGGTEVRTDLKSFHAESPSLQILSGNTMFDSPTMPMLQEPAKFLPPLVLDDGANKLFVATSTHLWANSNPFVSPWTSWTQLTASFADGIDDMSVSPRNNDLLYVLAGNTVYLTKQASSDQPTFQTRSAVPSITGSAIGTSIRASRFSLGVAYVTVGGYGGAGKVYKTTDYGATWTDITSNLPQAPAYVVSESPWDPATLYVGTELGVYGTGDGGATWAPITDGPGIVATWGLAWQGNRLVAATHGRGAFISFFPNDLRLSLSHGDFFQGQQNATYTLTVSNAASGASSGSVSVTETLPPGLTLASAGMSGSGWNCVQSSCSRSDSVAASGSYPPITVSVNVGSAAAPSVVNSATVTSNANTQAASSNTARDTTAIAPRADVSVTMSHVGNFHFGQSGSYSIVVKNVGSAPTSGRTELLVSNVDSPLVLQGLTGAGWFCGGAWCYRDDALAPGQSYPLTLSVAVQTSTSYVLVKVVGATVSNPTSDITPGDNMALDATTILR